MPTQEILKDKLDNLISEYKKIRNSEERCLDYLEELKAKREETFIEILEVEDEFKKYDEKHKSYFSYLGI